MDSQKIFIPIIKLMKNLNDKTRFEMVDKNKGKPQISEKTHLKSSIFNDKFAAVYKYNKKS